MHVHQTVSGSSLQNTFTSGKETQSGNESKRVRLGTRLVGIWLPLALTGDFYKVEFSPVYALLFTVEGKAHQKQ